MNSTVVTPVYNRVSTIGQAVESVLSLCHRDTEHVVQDVGSTDETLQIHDKLSSSMLNVQSTRDGGIDDGVNNEIARATGNNDRLGIMTLYSDTNAACLFPQPFKPNAIKGSVFE